MYGWRARIGHVAPSRGDTMVYEFYKMFPEGFMILNSTGTIRHLVDADFDRQLQRIEETAQDLVENHCNAIIVGGSPLFTKMGYGSDTALGKKLTEKFGVPIAAGGIAGERPPGPVGAAQTGRQADDQQPPRRIAERAHRGIMPLRKARAVGPAETHQARAERAILLRRRPHQARRPSGRRLSPDHAG